MTTSSVLSGCVLWLRWGKRVQSGDMCEEMEFGSEFHDDVDGFERLKGGWYRFSWYLMELFSVIMPS